MVYNFKFSVIIAVYNVENYLNQTIKSIINQSLSFEKCVQLILVDDGSTDNSLNILKKFQQKYPNNIIVLTKENGGQASARNIGLKYAEGKYVNFLDSDDYLSKNTLKSVYNFFEKHYAEIDVVAILMVLFERVNMPHRLNDKFKKNRIIDLDKEPNNPQLSASSAFIKTEIMKKYEFDTQLINLEDALVINKIFLEKKKYGVINKAQYYYRQRYNQTSTVDSMKNNKKYYNERLKNFYLKLINYCIGTENKVPLFIQYLFAYDLQWLLKINDLNLLNSDEKNEFMDILNQILRYIDLNCIQNNKFIDEHILPFFIYLKTNNKILQYKNDNLVLKSNSYIYEDFSNLVLWFDIIEYENGFLNFSGNIETCFDINHINILCIRKNENQEIIYKCDLVKYNNIKRKNTHYLSINWKYNYNFDIRLPIELNDIIIFKVKYDDGKFNQIIFPHISFRDNCGLSTSSAYFVKDSYLILFKYNKFNIKQYSYKSMLRYEISNIRRVIKDKEPFYLKALYIKLLYFMFYKLFKDKRIWLYSDRPDSADDNAKHLFKYSHYLEDNIQKYFVINKTSDSYNEMKKISDNIVDFGSLKHKMLYLYSEKIISSYVNENFINPFYYITPSLYSGCVTSKRYFLQHGVTKDDISEFVKKYDKNLSLIVTVSDAERESFLQKGYNYDEKVIQTLGFPRFDNLKSDATHNQILFAPTWRIDLTNEQRFLESNYYHTLNNFLNNKKLRDLLKEHNYSLVFKPHPELEKNIHLLDIPSYIKISEDESYQTLFNTSSLLITDYSSIFFDFAYLKKPVIYYQKDNDYHYQKGYFKYGDDGFGDVISTEKQLIEKIKYYIIKKGIMENKYRKRVDNFFKYQDYNNSKRVYEWIKKS